MDETVINTGEAPASGAPATPEPAAPPAAAEPGEKSHTPDGRDDRIHELTRLRRDAERARDRAERDSDHWRGLAMRPQAPPQTPKTLDDFGGDQTALARHIAQTISSEAVAAARKSMQEETAREQESRLIDSYKKRETQFAKQNPDYFELTRNEDLHISESMGKTIRESEDGPALAYYLAKNSDIAEKISELSPLSSARELGRIEAKLLVERDKLKASAASKAPPPASTIDGAGDTVTSADPSDSDSDKLSDSEWLKRREKQVQRRRK